MQSPVIVVDHVQSWAPYAAVQNVIESADYLAGSQTAGGTRVINLCAETSYLSAGYYVSLLAEARGKRVLPSVRTLLELGGSSTTIPRLVWRGNGALRVGDEPIALTIHFGCCQDPRLAMIAAAVFARYPVPILHVRLTRERDQVIVDQIRVGRLEACDDANETAFAEALDQFCRRIWRRRSQGSQRHDLAILIDPEETLPPSNRQALRQFERQARAIGLDPELITLNEAHRLLEFDALFIRCTTAIDHPSYQMALQADHEGLPVIDHPDAILRCCNKVFLHDLLHANRIPMPASVLVMRDPAPDYERLIATLGLPLVLKIPDGSFSRGVYRVSDPTELIERGAELLRESAVIIAQSYVPTAYDWRIGVLDGRPLYACRYHMAPKHWQIVNHAAGTSNGYFGRHDCLPLAQVPGAVIRCAVKAARLIGNGLFGVDCKEVDGQPMVIEVNDNPSIDAGVEDRILGDELYRQIMVHLLNGLQARLR